MSSLSLTTAGAAAAIRLILPKLKANCGDNELTVPVVKKAKTTVTKKAAPKNPATTAAKQGLRRRQNLALAKLHKARLATKAKDDGKRPKSLSMAVIQAAHSNEED
ncbi:hypothetical protein B0H13DRAFT_2340516 [Mycena leptocephala]|nr:hypothetical protein B0H13DRAFT_2340516 [Mycena leptocephala]